MGTFLRSSKGTAQVASEAKQEPATADKPADHRQHVEMPAGLGSGPSFLGASLKVIGNLESDSEIQINGKIEGDIKGKVVTISEGGEVVGSVFGETVNIAGKLQGKIEARRAVVSKTARITGDIIHDSLQVEAGAYVNGHCRPEFANGESGKKPVELRPQADLKVTAGSLA